MSVRGLVTEDGYPLLLSIDAYSAAFASRPGEAGVEECA